MAPAFGRTAVFARGEARVDVVPPKTVVSRVTGYIDVPMMRHLLAHFEEWRSTSGDDLVSFHDMEEVTDYDPEARLLLTSWLRQHRRQFRVAHVLVRSRALTWGFRLLGTLTDDLIVAHDGRESFEKASPVATGVRSP